jgi:hypothetical protein
MNVANDAILATSFIAVIFCVRLKEKNPLKPAFAKGIRPIQILLQQKTPKKPSWFGKKDICYF